MVVDLSKLNSKDFKDLIVAVKDERDRRGRKNPAAHDPTMWAVPNDAIQRGKEKTAA